MEWVMVTAITIALALAAWSLAQTHSHASRITALETRQNDMAKRIDEKFQTLIDLNSRTLSDLREIKAEVRELRRP